MDNVFSNSTQRCARHVWSATAFLLDAARLYCHTPSVMFANVIENVGRCLKDNIVLLKNLLTEQIKMRVTALL